VPASKIVDPPILTMNGGGDEHPDIAQQSWRLRPCRQAMVSKSEIAYSGILGRSYSVRYFRIKL
jgi:hypothetical protein